MDATGALLARAFDDDPMFLFIEPDEDRRRRRLPWFFSAAARLGRQRGRLDATPEAAAIWLTPGRTELGPGALVRSGLAAAPARLGLAAFRRFVALTSAFEEAGAELRGEDHWHLFILGVDPDHRGEGRGTGLLAPILRRADEAGLPVSLETCTERNLPFYERHGFVIDRCIARAALPEFWTMVRRPA